MIKKWKSFLEGENYSLKERLFVLIILVMVLSFSLFLFIHALVGKNIRSVLLPLFLLLNMGLIARVSFIKKRIKTGSILLSALLTFVLLPLSFFGAGGIYGGPPILFILAVLFQSMILEGILEYFFLAANLVVALVCYFVAFSDPLTVKQNTTPLAYTDSFAALFSISVAVCFMIGYEIYLYKKANARAQEQRKEIETLNASQRSFFSSMSHEIRTPINTIIGLNEMILREEVSQEVAEDALNIQAASKILLHLINDILDMSKLESGSMELAPVSYHVGDMLSDLVGMFWGLMHEKGLNFQISLAPDVPAELLGDDVRIKQVLINVLNNALKYTKEGSVTLSIQCGKREGTTQTILYTITDTGIGIKKESIPYLFTAFKRVDEEKNHHIEGTGLGLSIVKQLVDLMGGSISVNSVYTQGSTFFIELPQQVVGEKTVGSLDVGGRQIARHRGYRTRFEAPQARVLVVDDNQSNLMVVTKLLRDTKVSIDTALSGEEALHKTLEEQYHVIFMDHLMPGMDGLECRRQILSQPGGKCRGAKIIALTANADGESHTLYEREGFDDYLTKPVDAGVLENKLCLHLPRDLVHSLVQEDADMVQESIAWTMAPQRKTMVAVTTESVADLPRELKKEYDIAVIPYYVHTGSGIFRDTMDLESDGLLAYMSNPGNLVASRAPSVAAYEAFFAEQLKHANNVIHIALSSKIANNGYEQALEASASFNNVTVFNSSHASSGQSLITLQACRMAKEGKTPGEILPVLETYRKLVESSVLVDSLDYLARAGQIDNRIATFANAMLIHPVVKIKNGKIVVQQIIIGSKRQTWKKYVASRFRYKEDIDRSILIFTYSDLTWEERKWIVEQVESHIHFEHVYYQKASAAIVANCGPGSFALLFQRENR